jgi:hypothetical protein
MKAKIAALADRAGQKTNHLGEVTSLASIALASWPLFT